MRSIRISAKTWAIPIINPLLWFMISADKKPNSMPIANPTCLSIMPSLRLGDSINILKYRDSVTIMYFLIIY